MKTYRIGGEGTHCGKCARAYMDVNDLDLDSKEDRDSQMVDLEEDGGDGKCAECGRPTKLPEILVEIRGGVAEVVSMPDNVVVVVKDIDEESNPDVLEKTCQMIDGKIDEVTNEYDLPEPE